MLIFALVAILIYVSVNTYIIYRGWQFIAAVFPNFNRPVYIVVMVILASLYILAMLFLRSKNSYFSGVVMNLSSIWLIVVMYSFLFLVSIDLIRGILYFVKPLNAIIRQNSNLLTIGLGLIFIVAMIAIIIIGGRFARNTRVSEYNLEIDKKAVKYTDLRMVMVSDIHLGQIIGRERLKTIVDKINELKPDIVFFGGDMIDGDSGPFVNEKMGEEFKRINARMGMYGVVGNHEYFGSDFEASLKALNESGIKMLVDETALVNDSFYIIGRNDKSGERFLNKKRKSIQELMTGIDKSKPVILLDHEPNAINDSVANFVDLQFSGHTHHGQVWPASIITKKMFEIDWGYLKKDKTNIIVSCGAGTWGPPIRLGSNSEVILANIKMK